LQEGELEVHFQPQADLHTGKIVGAESLLPLADTGNRLGAAESIISIAEDSDLMPALTMWVFKASLRHCANWAKLGIDISVSVNVTPSNLADPELSEFISQALTTWNVPPNKLMSN